MLVQNSSGDTLKIDVNTFLSTLPKAPKVVEATESLTTTGAISVTAAVSKITVNTGVSYTLAAGSHGQEKVIVCNSKPGGSSSTVTVTTVSTGASGTLTFSAVGNTATLRNVDGTWFVVGLSGATANF